MVLGTPLFMAPEQARGVDDLDHRIDLYAVGTMLYIMLSGRWPFYATNGHALLAKLLTQKPTPLRKSAPWVDDRIVEVVEKAMEKDRDKRFSSAREFIGAIQRVRAHRSTAPPPPAPSPALSSTPSEASILVERRGRGRGLIAVLLVFVTLGLIGGPELFRAHLANAAEGESLRQREGLDETLIADEAFSRISPSGSDSNETQRTDSQVAQRNISVMITTSPPDARLLLNGVPTSNPLSETLLRAEEDSFVIDVEAEGHRPLQRVFARAADVEELLVLEPLARPAVNDSQQSPNSRPRSKRTRTPFRFDLE